MPDPRRPEFTPCEKKALDDFDTCKKASNPAVDECIAAWLREASRGAGWDSYPERDEYCKSATECCERDGYASCNKARNTAVAKCRRPG